jgi:flagellar biosynthesis protein FlhF
MSYEDEVEQIIEGASIEECRDKLFKLYGNDYKITNRKTIFKPTLFHLSQKEVQKVSYVVNHHKSFEESSTYQKKTNDEETFEKNRMAILQNKNNVLLVNQISQMNSQLEKLQSQISTISNVQCGTNDKHENITKIEEILEQNEFTFSYIKMIEDKIRGTFSLEQLDDYKLLQRYVVDWIGESFSITEEKVFRAPHVIILVGPTGVGKTTTTVKLAAKSISDARSKNKPRPEFCFITIDTMRVGAMAQIETFGKILEKNVIKAETSEDFLNVYNEYKDHVDSIYVDTSGYSPNDSTHIAQMKNILSIENMKPDVYLSLAATTKASDLINISRNYEPFGYDSVIVTKCDETNQIGNIISILNERHKSLAYITDGQSVARFIHKADKVDILKRLTGFEIDRIHIEDKFGEKD